ncbi:MAG: alpha/beta hydrolase family protein [Flavobacteriales bacterium]
MKTFSLSIALLLISLVSFSQSPVGDWYGVLSVQGASLNLVLHISESDSGYSTEMDSPDQGAFGIALESTTYKDGTLEIKMPAMGLSITGVISNEGLLKATYSQGPMTAPVEFSRKKKLKSQEPTEPFGYDSEEVTFENKTAEIALAGMLTLPSASGKHPAVILISGSGPQNRNEEILGHKPFLVLADHLTKQGIAVLRYDDRGVADSEGQFMGATSEDFAMDAAAAIAFLKNHPHVDASHIGVIGHSEGGLIAPMLAAQDKELDFIVLLAGPGKNGGEIITAQAELIALAEGEEKSTVEQTKALNQKIFSFMKANSLEEDLNQQLEKFILAELKNNPNLIQQGKTAEQNAQEVAASLSDPWFRFFATYEPSESLSKVTCPILALNGDKDLQVPADMNLDAIEKYASQTSVTAVKLKNLNHLFQTTETGAPSEYGELEETFNEEAMEIVSKWINEQIK